MNKVERKDAIAKYHQQIFASRNSCGRDNFVARRTERKGGECGGVVYDDEKSHTNPMCCLLCLALVYTYYII